jgi:hypothetical protein
MGSEVLFFTSNSTAEANIYKGSSKNKKHLHELLVELKVLQAHAMGFACSCATSGERG